MAQLAAITPLDAAVEDLRRWERKVHEAKDWLETALRKKKWEGRGADAFEASAKQRRQQLDTAAGTLRDARRALEQAQDEIRTTRKRIEAQEQAYVTLKRNGALPPTATGAPPPPGDTDWLTFLQGPQARAA